MEGEYLRKGCIVFPRVNFFFKTLYLSDKVSRVAAEGIRGCLKALDSLDGVVDSQEPRELLRGDQPAGGVQPRPGAAIGVLLEARPT